MSTQIIKNENPGAQVVGTPLTLANSQEAAPGLVLNAIDRRIVKVRPMATPLDQLSRCAGARKCSSMVVDYYSVCTKETEAKVSVTVPAGKGNTISGDIRTYTIKTDKDIIFEPTETILIPAVKGGKNADGSEPGPLVCYVLGRNSTAEGGGLEVIAVNPDRSNTEQGEIPEIPAGSKIIRMGRAAAELDVQTAQYQALPTKSSNNCQIFKMQVEESTFHKIASKEVGWSFSDQEEAAIIDMRLGMEKSFLFGVKSKLFDHTKNEDIYLTGGIWNQINSQADFPIVGANQSDLITLSSVAFSRPGASARKLMLAGSGLIKAISEVQADKIVSASQTSVKWGIEFKEIRTNFGSLFIVLSQIFDQCGHTNDGIIIDPDFLTKYVHVPFHSEKLDLRSSGTRNTSAVVITEASCLVLRYPNAHLRVLGKTS